MKSTPYVKKNHSKKLLTIITLSSLNLLSIVQAEVNLLVDDNIKVTAINGQVVNSSFLKNPKQQYNLQPGQHVITAKYNRLYDLNKDNHDFVRSGNITISAKMDDNQTYRLVMPNQPEKYTEAKKYAKNPTLAIMQNSQMIASQNTQSSDGSLLSGVSSTVGGWFGGSKALQANTKTIAAINNTNIQPTTAQKSAPITNTINNLATKAQSGTVLEQFMQLWLKASPEERARIRGWVAQ